jgi:hypothetical protein
VNPSAGHRTVELTMTLAPAVATASRVRLEGAGGPAELRVDGPGTPVRRRLDLPPGMSRLRFVGDGPKLAPPGDPRTLAFRVIGFTLSEPRATAAGAGTVRR